MKTLRLLPLLLGLAGHSLGQGTLTFANHLSGVFDAPVVLGGLPSVGLGSLAGSMVQLFVVNGTSLTPVGSPIGFRATSGDLAKYFAADNPLTIPGIPVEGTGVFRVYAWVGSTLETSTVRGSSPPFVVTALGGDPGNGNPPIPPALMINMKGFGAFAGPVSPEPSPRAMLIVGLVVLSIGVRKSFW
jgi:hypothetical protein